MNGTPPRGKALPARPSQDSSYGRGTPNGYKESKGSRDYSSNGSRMNASLASLQEPNGRIMLDGYRQDIMTGFESENPRYNAMNASRPQSSMLLNVNDPIQVHLLVETALGDSKEYEILSQEEVDDLKKQVQSLTQRIGQTRQNLAIQSKYRDAAISMARLYSPSDKKRIGDSPDGKKRRSLLGHSRNSSEQVREADQERMASERKCEDLAAELWLLEKRLMEPQSRLLKHTAGILQMTHKGPKRSTKAAGGPQPSGIPGSPESMYTYSNARSSMEPVSEEDFFDERSLYRSFDRIDAFGESEGPDNLGLPSKTQQEQVQIISKTEQRLEYLGQRLREIIVSANPQRAAIIGNPPTGGANNKGLESVEPLQSHLDYLETAIATIDQEHAQSSRKLENSSRLQEELSRLQEDSSRKLEDSSRLQEELSKLQGELSRLQEQSSRQQEESMRKLEDSSRKQEESLRMLKESSKRLEESEAAMEETLEGLNHEVYNLLFPYDEGRSEPPQITGQGMQEQLAYFQDSIAAMETELSRVATNTNKSSGREEQMETVMMGLWDIIQSGEEDNRQKKQERRKTRTAQNVPDDGEDSPDDEFDTNEPFSLQAFSTKVQWLYTQATRLKDQKKVLQRQIKQQRELNSKSDATKDVEMSQKIEELERTRSLLTKTEADADSVREQLSLMMEKLDEARQQQNLQDQARDLNESSTVRAVQGELELRNKAIAELEDALQDLKDDRLISQAETQSKVADSETKVAALARELATATEAQKALEQSAILREKEVAEKEKEMESMNMEVARLQTEVTIARAELDGAYGSRAQRAAEVAANPAIQKEIDDLINKNATLSTELATLKEKGVYGGETEEKVRTLKKELEETIEEYELMTKASIEWEKERENLEITIDKLRDERESMEAQLSDERVRWLGMKSPGEGSNMGGAGSTSTTVLKNEFKKMMRDTRAENTKVLRAEQAERRRLEDELRALKKLQGPGKSSLSQSFGS